jgi:chromosome segregation ATPase
VTVRKGEAMTDLVERLRDQEKSLNALRRERVEAADEIEQLRDETRWQSFRIADKDCEIERLRAERDQWKSDCELRSQTAIDRLEALRDREAEVERLRAVLHQIATNAERLTLDMHAAVDAELKRRDALEHDAAVLGHFQSKLDDYCEQCHGPCRRRPRHGEFNI